ncbi:unnamed protein product [Rodentolepis nana]|uniref:NACHT_N domain-containing protein n=1 Tax=Rodentolepis nana TaxID=102285 RepID=A0A0R3TCR9_RODNA|nr:unnamed protein product [Rodentolepis nana]
MAKVKGLKNPVLLKELADDMYKLKASLSKLSDDEVRYQLGDLLEHRRRRWISYIKDLYSLVGSYLKELAKHINEDTGEEYIPLIWTILNRLAPDALSKAKVSNKSVSLLSAIPRITDIYVEESEKRIRKLNEHELKKNLEFISSHSIKQYKIALLLLLFVEKAQYYACLTRKEKSIIQERIVNVFDTGADESDMLKVTYAIYLLRTVDTWLSGFVLSIKTAS